MGSWSFSVPIIYLFTIINSLVFFIVIAFIVKIHKHKKTMLKTIATLKEYLGYMGYTGK
ncbi:hypothetical protein [Paenibacillus phocaensis]|uniref:hypothetical protein n=1 Tax=Paenibacillus phocaensis TaxID=1776378 RepID=UPI000AABBAD6|nr:hypothetical protein [Paenibacillus phocaensis]